MLEPKKMRRADLREMRKRGFDLVVKSFRIGEEGGVPVTGDELDTIMDVLYPDSADALDAMSLPEQVNLAMGCLTLTLAPSDAEKNS
jgi:hypothetical protein